MHFDLPTKKYAGDEQLRAFYEEVLPRLRSLPGVQSAAAVSPLPILDEERTVQLAIEGRTVEVEEVQPWGVAVTASEDYLETLRLPLLQGRAFSRTDLAQGTWVALILIAVAAAGTYIPAGRATRVDPIQTLRFE